MTLRGMKFRLNGHGATLDRIFKEPPPTSDLRWVRIERLLDACKIYRRSTLDDGTHISHQGKNDEIQPPENGIPTKATVRQLRFFLSNIGARPENIDNFLSSA